jgi:putative salt-induced outer membrane protein
MTTIRVIALSLLCIVPAAAVLADDAPAPPPPQHEWTGKGQFGFLDSHGNSDAESINGNLDVMRYDYDWKNELYLAGLYGKSNGITSAERIQGHEQTNYNVTKAFFVFGGASYEHDEYDGFQYQFNLTTGVGYTPIDTKSDKLTVQIGAGWSRLRPETLTYNADGDGAVIARTPQDAQNEAIGTVGLNYLHTFNAAVSVTNKLVVDSGSLNTNINEQIGLAVKMSTKLALTVGYGIIDNTKPPPPTKRLDTIATVNLQYAF